MCSAARLVGPEVSWNLRPWWALRRESLSSDLDEDTVTMWPTCPKVRPRASARGSSGSGRSFVFLWFFNVPEPPRPSPPGLALMRRRNRAGVEVCAAAWTWASAPTRPILSRVTRAVWEEAVYRPRVAAVSLVFLQRLLLHSASFTCGLAGALASNPVDVVRTRMMNQRVLRDGGCAGYTGTLDCLLQVRTNVRLHRAANPSRSSSASMLPLYELLILI